MNILIVTAMFPPVRTGTSFYAKNLANALLKRGHNITLVTLKNKEVINESFEFKVIRLKAIHINVKNYFKHLKISSVFLSNYTKLNKISKENKTEIILLINHYLDIAFPAVYVANKTKIPLVVSVGTQMQSLNPIRNKILSFLDRLIPGKIIYPKCKNIISWDNEIHRYLEDVQNKKTLAKSIIIPFGVHGDKNEYINHKHDYSKIDLILGIGSIIEQRDFLFNIKVFKELLVEYPNLKLKIIGHVYNIAPLKLAKELGVEDKVEFTGEQPHDIVLKELKNSTLHWMMLSGKYVGLGTATIEAMQMGLPVISNAPSNLFGDYSLKDMKNYIYSDGKNMEHTKNKILEVLEREELRVKIGQNGKLFIENNLNWDLVSEKMEILFNKITHHN